MSTGDPGNLADGSTFSSFLLSELTVLPFVNAAYLNCDKDEICLHFLVDLKFLFGFEEHLLKRHFCVVSQDDTSDL